MTITSRTATPGDATTYADHGCGGRGGDEFGHQCSQPLRPSDQEQTPGR